MHPNILRRSLPIRVLGCSGAIAQDCRTTSFLLGQHILVDAGTGVGDLTLEEMRQVEHVLLSHSHLDHIAALPLLADAVGASRKDQQPLHVYALPQTIDALQAHIFNNVIWPDFTQVPTAQQPFVRLHTLGVGDLLVLAGTQIQVLPARHSVPAVGFAALGGRGWWVYSGDTEGQCPEFWQQVQILHKAEGVVALLIETAFSNRELDLARISRHLAPATLAQELTQLPQSADFPIYITHIKPQEGALVMREVRELEGDALQLVDLQSVATLMI